MKLEIRHVEPGDAPAIHAILTSAHVVDGTMRLPHAPLAQTEQRIAPEPGIYKLAALADGEVVGFAELITYPDAPRHAHAGEINMIAVREDRQARGIGRALMAEMISLADDWLGLVRLGLCVWTRNEHATRLYEDLGFRREGIRPAYARWRGEYLDALMMGRVRVKGAKG